MLGHRLEDLPGALEIRLDDEGVAGADLDRLAAVGCDDDASGDHVDEFIVGVGGMIGAGRGAPGAGHHLAVLGSVLHGCLHRGGTLDGDPARQVAALGMLDGAEFENGGSGHRMLLRFAGIGWRRHSRWRHGLHAAMRQRGVVRRRMPNDPRLRIQRVHLGRIPHESKSPPDGGLFGVWSDQVRMEDGGVAVMTLSFSRFARTGFS
ncbi:hypothetical protein MPLA_1480004 [Mesorhizobium sp. ORS 3359]|nr:hypothetical protein MPLA_1480004 [Mesorhizobium sp. ORS 3359]